MESGSERGMKEFYRLLGSINEDNVEQVNMRSVQEFLEIIITFDWNGLLKALLENAYIKNKIIVEMKSSTKIFRPIETSWKKMCKSWKYKML